MFWSKKDEKVQEQRPQKDNFLSKRLSKTSEDEAVRNYIDRNQAKSKIDKQIIEQPNEITNTNNANETNAHLSPTTSPTVSPRWQSQYGFEEYCTSRYKIIKQIGTGGFSVVCSARSLKTNQRVAIKKISGIFEDSRSAKLVLREIRLIKFLQKQYLGEHENIISIHDILLPPNKNFETIYIVTNLMDTDLARILKSARFISSIPSSSISSSSRLEMIITETICQSDCVSDPSWIEVYSFCRLVTLEWGEQPPISKLTLMEYVTTRWYNAPEGLFSYQDYNSKVDVWSVGCIFAEMMLGKPLFPGTDKFSQIELIINLNGTPSQQEIEGIKNEKMKEFVTSLPKKESTPLDSIFPYVTKEAIDLLSKMLSFSASTRISVEEALSHPFLRELHDPSDEPVVGSKFVDTLEERSLTVSEYKDLIYQEILSYHPEAKSST